MTYWWFWDRISVSWSRKLWYVLPYLRIEVHFFVCIRKWKDTGHVWILWSAKRVSKIYVRPVSFNFPMQTKNCNSILISMLWSKNRKKNNVNFLSCDWCLSFENTCICHGFLMLYRRRMTSECKYWLLLTFYFALYRGRDTQNLTDENCRNFYKSITCYNLLFEKSKDKSLQYILQRR